jgi:uncharacterized membrane protein
MNTSQRRTRLALRIVWISYALLFTAQALEVWTRNAPWIIWLAVLMPLLIFLPGMLRDNLRSFIWLCFVLLLYFMRLVVSLFEDPTAPLAVIGMVAVVVLFIAAMLYVRWRAQELRAAAAAASGHGE